MTPENTELKTELSDLREENELLLLQLHQVQEELESYYLRNLELEIRANSVLEVTANPVASSSDNEKDENLKSLQRRLKLIQNSMSWRMTAPLRAMTRFLLRRKMPPKEPSASATIEQRINFYERRLELLQKSSSWRLTGPYRVIGDVFRHGPGVLFGSKLKQELHRVNAELKKYKSQFHATRAERDSMDQRIRSLQSQVQQEEKARWRAEHASRQDLSAASREITQLRQEQERLELQLSESRQALEAKDNAAAELQQKQALMNEELVKAEAQLELIKDLMFAQTERQG